MNPPINRETRMETEKRTNLHRSLLGHGSVGHHFTIYYKEKSKETLTFINVIQSLSLLYYKIR